MKQKRQPEEEQSAPPTTDRPLSAVANLVAALWRGLANPILLLAITIVAFVLVLAALRTPQMPHPIYTDPAAATRWLLNTSSESGSTGELWSALGLFNLLHSTLLRILLVLIALMLAVQTASQIGAALVQRQMPDRLKAPLSATGMPVHLPKGGPIHRGRSALPIAAETVAWAANNHLTEHFGHTQQRSVESDRIDHQIDQQDLNVQRGIGSETEPARAEERILATRAQTFAYLRPLLLLGLLIGLLALWLNVTFGWEVISPSLAPTETYQYPPRDLVIQYPTVVADEAGFAMPSVRMVLAGAEENLVVGSTDRIGENRIITRPSVPALLVRAGSDGVLLARPGDPANSANQALGLSFPTPGSEESLILPDQGVGLRIIRRPVGTAADKTRDDEAYSVEIYEANSAAPAERLPLEGVKQEEIEVADGAVALEFIPTVGVVVAVRSEPGNRLYWLAGLLMLVGLIGFVRTPVYVLAQIGQWSSQKSYLITQSNSQRETLSLETSIQQADMERLDPTMES